MILKDEFAKMDAETIFKFMKWRQDRQVPSHDERVHMEKVKAELDEFRRTADPCDVVKYPGPVKLPEGYAIQSTVPATTSPFELVPPERCTTGKSGMVCQKAAESGMRVTRVNLAK